MTASAFSGSATVGICRCLMGFLWASAVALPVRAQHGLPERVALNGLTQSVSQSRTEPLATSGQLPALGPWAGVSSNARQTMVWVRPRASALGLGLGVEQREGLTPMAGGSPIAQQAGLLVGVSLATGPHSALTLQTPLSTAAFVPDRQNQSQPLRMGLVFDTSKPYEDLRRGVRVELSGQTTVSFKPRGGRISLTVQSRW